MFLMGKVSVTSASQTLESLWNIWSQVTQQKKQCDIPSMVIHLVFLTRMPFQRTVLAHMRNHDGNMKLLWPHVKVH